MVKRNGWHEVLTAESYVLSRCVPPRFDVQASASFPPLRPSRLAQQIRQDLWRELKSLRGFSPVVRVDFLPKELRVTAGGRILGAGPQWVSEHIQSLLDDPVRRQRWSLWARETDR